LVILDSSPDDPTNVFLISLNGRNEEDTDLRCSAEVSDPDNDELDCFY